MRARALSGGAQPARLLAQTLARLLAQTLAPLLGAAALALPAAGAAAAAGGKIAAFAPSDLSVDGAVAAQRARPVVILFSLPGCAYCEVVRHNYLAPLAREGPVHARPIVREMEITDRRRFVGFDKKPTSGVAMASHYGVRFAPTVLLLDQAGKVLAPPLVGGDTAGMYGAYLDTALAEAGRKVPVPPTGVTR